MAKRALITGVAGQDGSYLSRLLLEKGYTVYGILRKGSDSQPWRHRVLGLESRIRYIPLEAPEVAGLVGLVEHVRPDEVYNLGSPSSVAFSFEQPLYTAEVAGLGAQRWLEAIRLTDPRIKFYQASSSEMFGKARETPQSERTPFCPRSPYAVSKLFAHWMTVNYREAYGLFACSGILFNHESPLRGFQFVTRKITRAVGRITQGLQEELTLGNLEARRDWGYAQEYVEAMWLMFQQAQPDDYVIATGQSHSVREFVEAAFAAAGIRLGWTGKGLEETGVDQSAGKTLVRIAPELFRPAEVDAERGDWSRARERLGWAPRTNFRELVNIMVRHDLERAAAEAG